MEPELGFHPSTHYSKTRRLGHNGLEVSALGFGAMGLSAFYGKPPPDKQRFRVLDRAHELGATFWDTADVYGDNEDLIGRWFERTGKRDEIFLCTKFANRDLPNHGHEINNSPEYIRSASARSLQRLGTATIDLYYCHRLNGQVPIETIVATMASLVKEGKVRYLGLSEVSARTLRRAHAVYPIAAVQMEYSPFSLDIESPGTGLLRTCRELGVAVVAYSPLGRGFLTGAIMSRNDFDVNDFRNMVPRFSEENFVRNLELVEGIGELAERKGCTKAQLVLAWVMAQGEDVVPIPGTKRVELVEENMGALGISLSRKEEREMRGLIERVGVVGERYPEALRSVLFADTPEIEQE